MGRSAFCSSATTWANTRRERGPVERHLVFPVVVEGEAIGINEGRLHVEGYVEPNRAGPSVRGEIDRLIKVIADVLRTFLRLPYTLSRASRYP